uniref:Ubiquitin-like 1-activating enzyme E1A n=1 Tax=Pinguiococcus pyrenoidosus TaxID=172671 RepID=A0A7R9YA67_9STRA|mmetsp:Transcript_14000/g.52319  ORF Transcript_14000/g.52319 Transcript_14000/m.52319 type:complete len:359 (+) Transcript_14000:162-1238(+)
MSDANVVQLDEREAEIYDRQIRLWGVAAQKRMQQARVLFLGVTALSAEVAKNLVLAGISVTLQDGNAVRGRDLGANFFLAAEDVGANRAEAARARVAELNPLASVEADPRPLEMVLADSSTWTSGRFNVIVMTTGTAQQQRTVDLLCRSKEPVIAFYAGTLMGLEGWFFADAGETYTFKKDKVPGEDEVFDSRSFVSLEVAEDASWDSLRSGRTFVPPTWVKAALLRQSEIEQLILGGAPEEQIGAALWEMSESFIRSKGEARPKLPGCATEGDWLAAAAMAQAEVSPVAAIVGGMLAQEVIKVISNTGTPMNNLFAFDGLANEGREVCLGGQKVRPGRRVQEVEEIDIIPLSSDEED